MTHGSLFSGIGGFDLAAEWMNWENVFHCEWIDYKQKFLEKRFSNAKSYGDISTTDFTVHRGHIDVLTGGFPCQDASIAKQDGKGQQGLQGGRTSLFTKWLEPSEKLSQNTLLPKTSQIFLKLTEEQTLDQFYPNWPDWGIMQNGEFVVRQKSVRPITVPGCIWLLTPTASECNRPSLSFPMFQRRHHRSPGALSEHLYRLVGAVPGRLNPQFYAWMMGYPLGWLGNNSTDTETQSYHK